jgi:hypothetical protein
MSIFKKSVTIIKQKSHPAAIVPYMVLKKKQTLVELCQAMFGWS